MTEKQRKALEELKAKKVNGTIAESEEAELAKLEAMADAEDGDGGDEDDEKSYGEGYVKGLRKENAKWRNKLKETETKLAAFDGIDPDAVRELLEKNKQKEKEEAEKSGDFDKLREQMLKEHQKEISAKDAQYVELESRYAALETEVKTIVLSNEIATHAASAECLNPKLLYMAVAGEAVVETTEDGKRVVRFKDEDGEVRYNTKTGKPLSVKDRIAELKNDEEYAMLFKGGNVGAGSSTSGKGTGQANPWRKDTFNLTEQGRIIRENPALAAKLKAEAGVN